MIRSFLKEEDGQDLIEYSMLLAFVGLAAVALLTSTRTQISGIWTRINTKLTAVSTAVPQ